LLIGLIQGVNKKEEEINGRCFWWVGVSVLDGRVNVHVDPMPLSAAWVGTRESGEGLVGPGCHLLRPDGSEVVV
jgi:hypothetical protein